MDIITGVLGGSVGGYFMGRRGRKLIDDHAEIENIKATMDIYKQAINDLQELCDVRCKELQAQIDRLTKNLNKINNGKSN
jgi:hypothetical protein